jgi:hypothetical protein
VIRCGGVATSVRGETTSEREKGGADISWADVNLTGLEMKKIHAVDSVATNRR